MPLGVSYMGTKRALAGSVAECVSTSRPGPLLDVFAGMCSVGSQVSGARQVWNNDLQIFAATVAHAYFCAVELPPQSFDIADQLYRHFVQHQQDLIGRQEGAVERECAALAIGSSEALADFEEELKTHTLQPETIADREACRGRTHYPYRLFSSTYAGSYLGLKQSIEVDSIRYCLDLKRADGQLSDQQHQWLCLAVARAVSRCATSTGHFAQPLKPKVSNIDRYCRQRRRSIWQEWLFAIDGLSPVGTERWRSHNRVFHSEAVELLRSMDSKNVPPPAVVYADPPYTNDQYSRFYHLYETLMLYDYPASQGVGCYREDRQASSFSLKAGVSTALENLISSVANLGSDLVLSYPTNGLLERSREVLPDLLSKHFRAVAMPVELPHFHSAMGGSKGEASYAVTEVIYKAVA